MGNDLAAYIERLELIVFFAGYPLIYALVQYFTGGRRKETVALKSQLVKLLPIAYAFSGTLFLGLVLKNLSPNFLLVDIVAQIKSPTRVWAFLSLLFWLPWFSKKPIFSLLHSLVFFFLLFKDLLYQMDASTGNDLIKNDMKIYTLSLLLNAACFIFILLIHFLFSHHPQKHRHFSSK